MHDYQLTLIHNFPFYYIACNPNQQEIAIFKAHLFLINYSLSEKNVRCTLLCSTKISNEWKTFFSHVELQQVFGAIQISKPHVSVTTSSFPAKNQRLKQKIPRRKDVIVMLFEKLSLFLSLSFSGQKQHFQKVKISYHYLQNLEKRSVVVQTL